MKTLTTSIIELCSIQDKGRYFKLLNLIGGIVLEITIAPCDKVLSVRIKSSELNDPKLELRLVARIKRFDFGSDSVEKVTVIFPIEFLPS